MLLLIISGGAAIGLAGCEIPPEADGPTPQRVQGTDGQPLSAAQLEQLVSPIALYPDALLAQVLMASTYPLEIVQAQRWLARGSNRLLSGDALVRALEAESWDPSVKSLVPFPDVLSMMSQQLEWTQQLGDAVLAQQDQVLGAIQSLRRRAQASGALQSGPQQTVTMADGGIVIEPAQPNVVYLPLYDPNAVYGTWPYPAYPPYYWGVGATVAAGILFAAALPIVTPYWGWARLGWGGGGIGYVPGRPPPPGARPPGGPPAGPRPPGGGPDAPRPTPHGGGRWQHDPAHRQGVAYRNDAVRDRYQGSRPGGVPSTRDQYRGRGPQTQPAGPRGPSGFEGIGRGNDMRAASDRGMASRGPQPSVGPSPSLDRGSYGSRGGYGGGGPYGGRGGGPRVGGGRAGGGRRR